MKRNKFKHISMAIPTVIVLASIGVLVILKSNAATPFASLEPENGTIKTPAISVSDSTASGSKAIKFQTGVNPFYTKVCQGKTVLTEPYYVRSAALTEISGIVASRSTNNSYWVNNDSGDSARVFAMSHTGVITGIFNFSGAGAYDWEDIDMGPGPIAGTNYIYAADIGDNDYVRPNVQFYRVPEPNPANGGATTTLTGVGKLTLKYPDGSHNAEGSFIDPITGEIYILEKVTATAANVYRAPGGLADGSTTTMTKVGTLPYPKAGAPYEAISGADISSDGTMIAVRTYADVRVYNRAPGQSVMAALGSTVCKTPRPNEGSGESVAFKYGNNGTVTISEGTYPLINNVDPVP